METRRFDLCCCGLDARGLVMAEQILGVINPGSNVLFSKFETNSRLSLAGAPADWPLEVGVVVSGK
jgi:hypothetical protein